MFVCKVLRGRASETSCNLACDGAVAEYLRKLLMDVLLLHILLQKTGYYRRICFFMQLFLDVVD